MIEFTGERVIPGEVNEDLWAEHMARYQFAREYFAASGALDLGCGTGYGTAALTTSRAIGIDISHEAIAYAREHFLRPMFLQASAAALPFREKSFDLVTAFEVIEHLEDWRALLGEARRVLTPEGLFLVSTPNKLYYSESRAKDGPNPFHVHEFEFEEFRDALGEFFPQVTILVQNRAEAIVFAPTAPAMVTDEGWIDGELIQDPASAHFFLALCSMEEGRTLTRPRRVAYVPRTANILRERERHIALLEEELGKNKRWLESMTADRDKLLDLYTEQKQQLEEHNLWAMQLERDWRAALERITQLQDELKAEQAAANEMAAGYTRKVDELQQENQRRAEWAMETEARFSAQLAAKCAELAETVALLDKAEATVVERTRWAQQLQTKLGEMEALVALVRQSRWVKLGRAVGVGPRVNG